MNAKHCCSLKKSTAQHLYPFCIFWLISSKLLTVRYVILCKTLDYMSAMKCFYSWYPYL